MNTMQECHSRRSASMIILNKEFLKPSREARILSILEYLAHDSGISQYDLGQRTHLSGAMVNQYLKDLQRQKLIRYEPSNGKKYRYVLTKKGDNCRLAGLNGYSSELVRLYTALKTSICQKLDGLARRDVRNIVLFGASETCEVVLSAIRYESFEVVAITDNDPGKQGTRFHGHLVIAPSLLKGLAFDAVVITSFGYQDEIAEQLPLHLGKDMEIVRL